MIPEHLDDGFTFEVGPGVYARPMLWADKQEWKLLGLEEQRSDIECHIYGDGDYEQYMVEAVQVILGYTSREESQDFQDLSNSIELQILNPGLSTIDCRTCRRYCMDHENGTLYIGPSGHPTPLPRNAKVPCETQIGCPKGHWSEPVGLSNERWARTWRHYWKYHNSCTPDLDEIVTRNRLLINWTVNYGRDRRFDPFVGGSPGGRSSDASTEISPGQGPD